MAGAKRLLTPEDDPLSASFETVEASRKVGFDSAYFAAQESLRVFQALPVSTPTAFIFTGNALSQIAIPGIMPFAFGKVASAMLIEYAANAYGNNGHRYVTCVPNATALSHLFRANKLMLTSQILLRG